MELEASFITLYEDLARATEISHSIRNIVPKEYGRLGHVEMKKVSDNLQDGAFISFSPTYH